VLKFITLLQMTWLSPHVGHTLPFSDAHQALALLQSGKTTGKVLLEVNRQ
jgi:NADPH:quinone reductase-like Zn-dependent oxidoreductase